MTTLRLRLAGWHAPGEYRVDVVDPALARDDVALDHGLDTFCIYGPTPLAALRAALRAVVDGSAGLTFAENRRELAVLR